MYTGARRSEVEALRWEEHIDLENGWVFIPGTKTTGWYRKVPLPAALAKYLRSTSMKFGPVVQPWPNVGRDLPAASARAGIPRTTPNDLRQTYASWMKQAGEDSAVVAKLLGHSSTRTVNLVYGRLSEETLVKATASLPSLPLSTGPNGSKTVAESGMPLPLERSPETNTAAAEADFSTPENTEPRLALAKAGASMNGLGRVPGGGIEPPTRGFSVPCSTD